MAGPSIADRLKARVDAPAKAADADGIRRRYALLIGIDHYDDPEVEPLAYCVRDVKRLATVLEQGGYRCTVLTNGGPRAPTLANVRRALAALVKGGDEDDVLLVHFSCHGQLIQDRPHLLMQDTPAGPAAIREHGLPLGEVLKILRGAPRRVAVFLDACHMGLGLDRETVLSTKKARTAQGAFALLAGSTEGQLTQDSEALRSGIFTAALLKGLGGAAAEPDGRVRFSVLAQLVQREVAAWRRSVEGASKKAKQTPVVRLEVADLELLPPIGYVPLRPSPNAKITSAQFSGDGRWLATGSEDCTVRLWSPKTGQRLETADVMRHDGYVKGLSFSPDGILLASVSNDGSTRVWQVPGCNEITPGPENQQALVNAIAWSPRGQQWVSACSFGVLLQDTDAIGRPLTARSFDDNPHVGEVWAAAFHPDAERCVTGGADGTVRLWGVADSRCVKVFKHEGPVWAVAVSPDGRSIAAAGSDEKAAATLRNVPRVWDIKTGKTVLRLEGHARAVTAITYSPHGDRIATSSYDGTARIWSARDGALLQTLSIEHAPEAYAAAFSPGGDVLFVGFADGRGAMFDIASTTPDHVQE